MSLSKRKKIENDICSCLEKALIEEGYIWNRDLENNILSNEKLTISMNLSFSLTDTGPYYFSDRVSVTYKDLVEVVQDLVKDSGFSHQVYRCQISTGTHVSTYFQKSDSRFVSSSVDVASFVDVFLVAFRRAEQDFIRPYLDITKAVHECTLFYTKWPKNMNVFNTAFCLIAYGIQNKDFNKIQLGVDRILKKINMAQTDEERGFALAVRDAAIKWTEEVSYDVVPHLSSQYPAPARK